MQRLHVDRRLDRCAANPGTEHISGGTFELRLPRCDLVGMDVELLRKLCQCGVNQVKSDRDLQSTIAGLTNLFGAIHVACGLRNVTLPILARKSRLWRSGNWFGGAVGLFQQNRHPERTFHPVLISEDQWTSSPFCADSTASVSRLRVTRLVVMTGGRAVCSGWACSVPERVRSRRA
jgi:hypothetical protein